MTSKHCFFRMMKEDFRHKTWMLVLSVLGNMMAVPVTYLISTGNGGNMVTVRNLTNQAEQLEHFFVTTLMITGGIVAIAGALIVGLAGFRYVFHRNMMDTYHSIPVSRSTLFLVNWLNGFLIWFGPFLALLSVTLLLGLGKLSSLRNSLSSVVMSETEKKMMSGWVTGGRLLQDAFVSLLALTVAFLLVYHLVLLAAMLCGNMLNTLVAGAALGTGAIAVYTLFYTFCGEYFKTFVQDAHTGYQRMVYASPLASSIVLLVRRGDYFEANGEGLFWLDTFINLVLVLVLGVLAFYGYRKRPSELAEQGLRNKPVRFLIQITVSFAAAMSGWIFFYMIGDGAGLFWGIFGAVLAGGVSFGVLDIIFHMDFKSFFAHKALMGVMVAAGVCTGFLFYYDWIGYDSYLPGADEIAEIAVYDNLRNNGYGYYHQIDHEEHPINGVHIRDGGAAYAFLESVTAPMRADAEEAAGDYGEERILTRVTLQNGRTYYRTYTVTQANSEPAYRLLSSPEYLDVNYKIAQEEKRSYQSIALSHGNIYYEAQMNTEEGVRLFEALRQGYNRDLEENPQAFICGDGRLFCSIKLFDEHYNYSRYLEIFEGMTHTREVLRQLGFAEFVEPETAENVEEIRLSLGYRYAEEEGGYNLVEMAREVYGVNPAETTEEVTEDPETGYISAKTDQTMPAGEIVLHITDKEEIRELLGLLSYEEERNYGGAFRVRQVYQITLVPVEGETEILRNEIPASIPYGALPEKYILRFGSLASETVR